MRYLLLFFFSSLLSLSSYSQPNQTNFINNKDKSILHYGNDKEWYRQNIPFFECSDEKLEDVYYYRWKLYKAHLRNIGERGYVVTEFLNAMFWDHKPYNTLNAATVFHIYEGRWLRNSIYMNNYIDFMYQYGGNNRRYTEAIADATYADFLVKKDTAFILRQLPSMINIYEAWVDQFDKTKNLYFVEPVMDATENTISSIDASGGTDGFTGGHAFRPSLNSYMYANAIAIKNIALLKGDTKTANLYQQKALQQKQMFQDSLWNPQLNHFTDRYKIDNEYVKYWDFIRGRELVGFVPWVYNLPDDNFKYNSAWIRLMDSTAFAGKYGLRTLEPSYEYYMKQYRFDPVTGQRECQWNGPSWPYQTSQILMGMGNLLNNYGQDIITKEDYLTILRQYANQHYKDHSLNIMENYDPDRGGAIADFDQRSEHYNHSEFNDLIITGLCGIRPSEGNQLEINPLISLNEDDDKRIKYFCLENVRYHGHNLSILYDEDGKKYNKGKGISVYVNGKMLLAPSPLGKKIIKLPASQPLPHQAVQKTNLAVNINGKGYPKISTSYASASTPIHMVNDGRVWYFKDVINAWSTEGSEMKKNWVEVDFGTAKNFEKVILYFNQNDLSGGIPENYYIEYLDLKDKWVKISNGRKSPKKTSLNTANETLFKEVVSRKVRVTFENPIAGKYTSLGELEIY